MSAFSYFLNPQEARRREQKALRNGGLIELVEEAERVGVITSFVQVLGSGAEGAIVISASPQDLVIVSRKHGEPVVPFYIADVAASVESGKSHNQLSSLLRELQSKYYFSHITQANGRTAALEVFNSPDLSQHNVAGYVICHPAQPSFEFKLYKSFLPNYSISDVKFKE